MPDEKQLVPAVRENLVALRDRREAVIAALTEHFAKDVLDIDEYDRRIDLAHQARSLAELDDLVVDLAPVATTALATTREPMALDAYPDQKRWLCIFGGIDKRGRWTVPRHMRVVAVMGGAQIDLREADLAPGVTELHVTCVMGGCHLIVPPNLAVEVDGSAIMGGFQELERGHGEPDPGRSLLRVTGLCVMGGFSVETRMPGESGRQARKRIKRERRAQKRLVAGGSRQLASGSGNDETPTK